MYLKALESLISSKKIPNAMLFFGNCHYQVNEYANQSLECIKDSNDEPLVLYFEAYDFNMAKNHLSQPSLFGGKNILVIKTDKNINQKELSTLVSKCRKISNNYLLIEYYGDDKNTRNMSNLFKKEENADFARFFTPNYQDAINLMSKKARQMGLNISAYTLGKLFLAQNENLALAISEFGKFALLDKSEITQQDVEKLVYGLGTIGIENFINKILNHQDIKNDFKTLSEEKSYDDVFLINSIQTKLTQLFMLHLYIKINGSFNAKEVLGYVPPPQISNILQKHSLKISLKKFQTLSIFLADSELKLKTDSHIEKSAFLLSVIIKIQNILKSQI